MTRADDRLMAAVVAEHAAIFGYGPVGARLDASTVTLAQAAEAAYALPAPVTDQASALKLAIMIEERTAAIWRAALIDTTGDDRRLAVDGLIDAAIRATRFRKAAGVTPTTVAFPGRLEPN